MKLVSVLAIFAVTLLSACGGKHPGSYEIGALATTAPTATEGVDAKMAGADALWDKRADEASLKQAIALYTDILAADTHNRHALERLVRGWYFYGDAFTDDVEQKLDRWGKAIGYGTQCLALNETFAAKIAAGEKEKDAAAAATKEDVACLYWTSSALGKWAKAQSLSTTLKHLPTVKAYIAKVEELDPTYYNYGPARYWGAYYAALPSFAGKDLQKSSQYLSASLEGAPDYLATRVIRAEYLAVESQDVKLFEDDLNFVLQADPNKLPEVAAENLKEQEKAKKLLEKQHELFLAKSSSSDGN